MKGRCEGCNAESNGLVETSSAGGEKKILCYKCINEMVADPTHNLRERVETLESLMERILGEHKVMKEQLEAMRKRKLYGRP